MSVSPIMWRSRAIPLTFARLAALDEVLKLLKGKYLAINSSGNSYKIVKLSFAGLYRNCPPPPECLQFLWAIKKSWVT